MISIHNKKDCVGCNACVQSCPKNCIAMSFDEEGFLYPNINLDACINCHICEKVCPVLNVTLPQRPISAFAAKNINTKIQKASSSGGVFFAIAKEFIKDGGIVFGAKFNEQWEVVHDYTETVAGLKVFQGSKYVQSKIGNTYKQAEEFLKLGKKVLFTGTPCQIRGLDLYLKKDYGNNLLKMDFICHGVPSPMIWNKYLRTLIGNINDRISESQTSVIHPSVLKLKDIRFRDKKLGWERYGFALDGFFIKNGKLDSDKLLNLFFQEHKFNIYMKGFLNDIYLRPSCYSCPVKCLRSSSDITIGDFWGISKKYPELYDSNGVSLILFNTLKSKGININDLILKEVDFDFVANENSAITSSPIEPKCRRKFFNEFRKKGISCIDKYVKKCQLNMIQLGYRKACTAIKIINSLRHS